MQLDPILAVKSNIFRAPEFQTRTYFHMNNSSEISVKRERVDTAEINESSNGVLRIEENQKYHSGYTNLQEKFLDGVLRNNLDEAWQAVSIWLQTLEAHSKPSSEVKINRFNEFCLKHLGQIIYSPTQEQQWIPGKYLDLIFSNILISNDTDSKQLIDLEWQLHFDIPTGFVIDRGLYDLSQALARYGNFVPVKRNSASHLPIEIDAKLKKQAITRFRDSSSFRVFEIWFQSVVNHGDFDISLVSQNGNYLTKLFNKGRELKSENKISEAIDCFSKILVSEPNHAETYNELGVCYFLQNKRDLALQSFMNAVKLNPNNRAAVLNLSETLLELKQDENALKILSFLTKNNPQDIEALLLLEKLYSRKGDKEKAMEVSKKVLVIDPFNDEAIIKLREIVA